MLLKIGAMAVLLLQLAGAHAAAPPRQTMAKVQVGQLQPLSQLLDINGHAVPLHGTDRRKLLIFFATWCHDSQRLMRQLLDSALLNDPTLLIVAIGRDEQASTLQQFLHDYPLPFPLVADPERQLYRQFTDQGVPRVVLVDTNNRVVKTFLGEMPRAIDEIVWPSALADEKSQSN